MLADRSGASRSEQPVLATRSMKTRLFLFSVLVCAFVGPLIGLAVWLALAGNPAMLLSTDFAGAPLYVYALIVGAPVGVVAAMLATLICSRLLLTERHPTGLTQWLLVGAGAGVGIGILSPLFLMLVGWGDDGSQLRWASTFAAIGGTAGAFCGLLIGAYCWRLARQPRVQGALPGR